MYRWGSVILAGSERALRAYLVLGMYIASSTASLVCIHRKPVRGTSSLSNNQTHPTDHTRRRFLSQVDIARAR